MDVVIHPNSQLFYGKGQLIKNFNIPHTFLPLWTPRKDNCLKKFAKVNYIWFT